MACCAGTHRVPMSSATSGYLCPATSQVSPILLAVAALRPENSTFNIADAPRRADHRRAMLGRCWSPGLDPRRRQFQKPASPTACCSAVASRLEGAPLIRSINSQAYVLKRISTATFLETTEVHAPALLDKLQRPTCGRVLEHLFTNYMQAEVEGVVYLGAGKLGLARVDRRAPTAAAFRNTDCASAAARRSRLQAPTCMHWTAARMSVRAEESVERTRVARPADAGAGVMIDGPGREGFMRCAPARPGRRVERRHRRLRRRRARRSWRRCNRG